MGYREDSFKAKFADAAQQLGVAPGDLASLKLRETVPCHSDYADLLQTLGGEAGLSVRDAAGAFRGRAHLVGEGHEKVALVEHETGLEILYIAGSVASLLGLIPVVLGAWHRVRGGVQRRDRFDLERIEVRRFDEQGQLREEELDLRVGVLSAGRRAADPALASLGHLIDRRVQELTDATRFLAARLDALEKQLPGAGKSKPKRRTQKLPPSAR